MVAMSEPAAADLTQLDAFHGLLKLSSNPSTTCAARQASLKRASRAWSSLESRKPTSGSKSSAGMESPHDSRRNAA